jgi:hypothetical protein
VADQRPIPTANDEQLEVLARLRVRAARRRHRRCIALRDASRQIAELAALLHTAGADERVNSGARLKYVSLLRISPEEIVRGVVGLEVLDLRNDLY